MSFVGAAGAALGGAIGAALGGDAGPDITPGSSAAWAASFHVDEPGSLGAELLSIGSDTYDGSITATLPDDLTGGAYEIVVEGMTDDDYAKIRLDPSKKLAVQLHLWWKDAPAGILGDLASFTGFSDPLGAVTPKPPEHSLVAVLRVDSLRRRAGARRYEAVVVARERVVARLDDHRVAGLCYDTLKAAFQAVARDAGIELKEHQLDRAAPPPKTPDFATTSPGKGLESTTTLVKQARDSMKLFGRSIAIIRDGTLHVGDLPTPLGRKRGLGGESGLVAVERGPNRDRDRAAGEPPPSGAPRARGTVTITTLGRPDIKPGDELTITLPSEDFPKTEPASLGSALLTTLTGFVTGGEDDGVEKTCLVGQVQHKISRRQGFVTTIKAIVYESESDKGWDPAATARPAPDEAARDRGTVPPDPAQAAAEAVHHLVKSSTDRGGPRIAQVRKHPDSTGSNDKRPRETSDVWYVDVAADGLPGAAQRVEITEKRHGELREVPYASPYAWGAYGLVLPRYPGTRVLLQNAGGGPEDLVDVGAIWRRDEGPPAKPGDFWLVLPVGLSDRESIGSDDKATDGLASHDLIDGDGTRVIETSRFVIRVTEETSSASDRPEPGDAPDHSVLIETRSSVDESTPSAQILLRSDGSIAITGSSISLDAGSNGDITLNAKSVKVTVQQTMDVS
jgi:hypothetical protein